MTAYDRSSKTELSQIMSRNLICVRHDFEVATVIGLMIEHHVGCIPVVDDHRRPIGVITKFDLVEQLNLNMRVVAKGQPHAIDIAKRNADQVMMPIALTLDESATVGDAASMMTCEDLHHVLVVSHSGALVGVVSAKDIVTWLVRNEQLMPFTSHQSR
jgi:CBS-domain-containing membrane protein